MHTIARSRRLLPLVLLVLMALGCCLGCGGEPAAWESASAGALRERFPDQAAQVLEQGEAFVATEEGFARNAPIEQGAWQRVEVVLPRDGREAIRLRGFGGVEVRVRELGVQGEGALAQRAVAYPRAGGASFWAAVPGGVEEWLLLDPDAVRGGEAVATWEVEGATVRQRGEGVEVVDAGGVVRLSVSAPKAYAAGGREIGARLSGSEARIELEVDAVGEAVLVDPIWVLAAPMSQPWTRHAAALLGNGQVLVAGGSSNGFAHWGAALYDPPTNSWSLASHMNEARYNHAATLLGNGKVLVTGGATGSGGVALNSSELYDPATNTWSLANPMINSRSNHTATLLPDSRVLVVGGPSAELYNPANNSWSLANPPSQGRSYHTASILGNGDVLVAGGLGATAERYHPATNSWTPAGSMLQSRSFFTATLLPDGRVLVAGGGFDGLASAELYDPATNAWSPAGSMSQARGVHTATLLGGKVLVAGGSANGAAVANSELYDPATNSWSPGGPMNHGRYYHTATLLGSGAVLVAGGQPAPSQTSAELYTLLPLGSPCVLSTDCQSGFCVEFVCCNAACDAGPCDACSVAAGAAVEGTCASLTGPACDDGDACTQTDTCQAGACTGANPVTCAALDPCHDAGVCDPATGACTDPMKPDGAACSDGDACTEADTCLAGVCTAGTSIVCQALDACHVAGVCDPATGCTNPPVPDATPCDDGDACTQADTCLSGACVGGNPVVCEALDTCHVAGVCDAATGVCTNPSKPDTAACDDGDACTQTDTCLSGICVGSNPVVCQALDTCHAAGVCDAATGNCTDPSRPDGAACPDGTCNAGVCIPTLDGGTGGGGNPDTTGGCGCKLSSSATPNPGAPWVAVGLWLLLRRRGVRQAKKRPGGSYA